MAESFFATLETELLDRTSFTTRNQARSAVFDYIEGFYNLTPAALSHRIPLTQQLRKEHPDRPSYYLDPLAENCPQKRGNSSGVGSVYVREGDGFAWGQCG